MPPRRSGRSRVSSEPENLPDNLHTAEKRKREKENVTQSRKQSTRRDRVLKSVDEDAEEVDIGGRPAKKARSSTEGANSSDAEEFQEPDIKLKARRASKASIKPRTKVAKDSDEDEITKIKLSGVDSVDEDDYDDLKAKAKVSRRPKATPMKAKSQQPASVAASSIGPTIAPQGQDKPEVSLLDDDVRPPLRVSAPTLSHSILDEKAQGLKSRLTIHKMVLNDFKSYAGCQVIGPFHKSFSSIVGPNGSGKSNTIDALLFVFGYRASKMRQGKLSELIHNSARHPDLPECSVEVHFRDIIDLPGPDAFEVVPNSSLVIARIANRANQSRYMINHRVSSFTEVQTLLKGRGIDLDHKRFLILQGEVESIAQMKPKAPTEHEDGLLEYLEDIIGTAAYKEPIREALEEMDVINEERQAKLGRLRIVEKERNALSEDKKKAEDWLRMQNELVRAQSRLWQWYIWKCLTKEERYHSLIAELEQALEAEVVKNQDDVKHLEDLEKHLKQRGKEYDEAKAVAAEAGKDLAEREKQQVQFQERLKHSKTKKKKLEKIVQDESRARAEAFRTIEESTEKIKHKKAEAEEREAELEREEKVLEGITDSLKDKTHVFTEQIEVKQRELQPWMAKVGAKKAEFDVASSERAVLEKKAASSLAAVQSAAEALQTLQHSLAAKTIEQEDLKKGQINQTRHTAENKRKLQDAQESLKELRSKAASARQKADEARASQAASSTQNRVLDGLNKLKKSGRLEGFHGRLGSLGAIEDKYDVAITTACGGMLNHMIVDTVEQGQACIDYLRKQSLGRASFTVLEKTPATSKMDKIQTPENVDRLFDLIHKKDKKFAAAFYKATGDTVVAQSMEQASRIAYGSSGRKWRVVTLAGELIDASGTMSGGGTTVSRGGMGSKLSGDSMTPEELRELESESARVQQMLDNAQQNLRQLEADIDGLERAAPGIDMELSKVALDIQSIQKQIPEAEKRVKDLRSQTKPDAAERARIDDLDRAISRAQKESAGLQLNVDRIQSEIEALEAKILAVGGSKLLSQKAMIDSIKMYIKLANDEITKAEVAKAKAQKDSIKFDSALEKNSVDMDESTEEIRKLERSLADIDRQIAEYQTDMSHVQEKLDSAKDALDTLKQELTAKTEEIQAFRQKELQLRQQVEEQKKAAEENDITLNHWQGEHDKLLLVDIDDDDEDEETLAKETAIEKIEADTVSPEDNSLAEVKAEPVDGLASALSNPQELIEYSVGELTQFSKKTMVSDIELLDEKLKADPPNMSVLKEYKRREAEYRKRVDDLDKITATRDAQKEKYDRLRKKRLDEFMAGFSMISLKLKEMYQMITLGGNAELELVDSMDPFSEGIIFSVMPPKKSWKNISNLSGGEKTLSSLALVFALHVFKPTPLYFMDEIDAALDFRNVSIVANYIKDRTKNAQFIIISLRNDMFELSHRLIGIYKTSNATRSIAIDNHALPVPTGGA